MVNAAETFISPGKQGEGEPEVSHHKQPEATAGVIAKIDEIPRRTGAAEHGFDGLGVVVVYAENNGTRFAWSRPPLAPQPGDTFYSNDMPTRMANEYDTKFSSI